MNGVHAATFRVVDILEAASIPYAVMGGVATQALAIPTATDDVDLTKNLLVANPGADRDYLRAWADRLGVRERLEQALAEADRFWTS